MNAKRLLKSIALAVAILMGVCLIGAGAGFVLRYIPAWLSVSVLCVACFLSITLVCYQCLTNISKEDNDEKDS